MRKENDDEKKRGRKTEHEALHFLCKATAACDKWYLVVILVPSPCFVTNGCSCVRNSMPFLNL